MRCPKCNKLTRVVDTRAYYETVRRTRICKFCGHKFQTFEIEKTYFSEVVGKIKNQNL